MSGYGRSEPRPRPAPAASSAVAGSRVRLVVEPELLAPLGLAADVDRRGRVVADQQHPEPGSHAARPQRLERRAKLLLDLPSDYAFRRAAGRSPRRCYNVRPRFLGHRDQRRAERQQPARTSGRSSRSSARIRPFSHRNHAELELRAAPGWLRPGSTRASQRSATNGTSGAMKCVSRSTRNPAASQLLPQLACAGSAAGGGRSRPSRRTGTGAPARSAPALPPARARRSGGAASRRRRRCARARRTG